MKKIILINAIIWAILILVSAYFFKDNAEYQYFLGFLLVGFSIINGLLAKYKRKITESGYC
ncbi:MAG: hypothetical protein ACWA42_09080 [Lutibacter sp.]